jgi:hypothetical protein
VETAERYDLLTTVLRDEWGFDGLVMTDWGNNSTHYKEAVAGNDVKMSSGSVTNLLTAIANGTLTRAELIRNQTRVMNVLMRIKTFQDDPGGVKIHTIKSVGTTHIEAEDFAEVTGAPASEATTDTGGGLDMGYLDAGGSITYYINVERSGRYNLVFRAANNSGSANDTKFHIRVDGNKVAESKVPWTGGWQNWVSAPAVSVPLSAGEHFFQIYINAGGSNLNWMELSFAEKNPIGNLSVNDQFEIYLVNNPNSSKGYVHPIFSVTNLGEARNVTLLVVSYDKDGRFLEMNQVKTEAVPPSAGVVYLRAPIYVGEGAAGYRAFLWDDDLIPLAVVSSVE